MKMQEYKGKMMIRTKENTINDGISQEHYVLGDNIALSPNDTEYDVELFAHEYGHTIQSRILGPLYMSKVAIPSGISAIYTYQIKNDYSYGNYHDKSWYEVWASRLGKAPNHLKEFRYNNVWYWFLVSRLSIYPN
jgi:hypothetical protein